MKLPELIVCCACSLIIGALGMAAFISHEDRFVCSKSIGQMNQEYLSRNLKLKENLK